MTRVYIALRDRSPQDKTVQDIATRFADVVTLDPNYQGSAHTLLRVENAESMSPEFIREVTDDFKGIVWPGTQNGQWAREYLGLLDASATGGASGG